MTQPSVIFTIFVKSTQMINRYLLLVEPLYKLGIQSFFLDLSGDLFDFINNQVQLLKVNHNLVYIKYDSSISDNTKEKEFVQESKIHFSKKALIPHNHINLEKNQLFNILSSIRIDNKLLIDKSIEVLHNKFVKQVKAANRVLEKFNNSCIVYDIELVDMIRAALFSAREQNIKIVSMQHAEGYAETYSQIPVMADYYIAYSPYNYKKCREMGVDDKNIWLTGVPDTDVIYNYNIEEIKNKLQEKYNINFEKKVVAIALKPNKSSTYRHLNDNLLNIICNHNFENIEVLVKLHPADATQFENINYQQLLTSKFHNIKILSGDTIISKIFAVSDYFITYTSSAVVESILQDVFTIVIEYEDGAVWPDWNQHNIYHSVKIDNLGEILCQISNGAYDSQMNYLKKGRKEFIYNFRYQFDNNASKRIALALYTILNKSESEKQSSNFKMNKKQYFEDIIDSNTDSLNISIDRKKPLCIFCNTYFGFSTNKFQKETIHNDFFCDLKHYREEFSKNGLLIDYFNVKQSQSCNNFHERVYTVSNIGINKLVEKICQVKPQIIYLNDISLGTTEFLSVIRPYVEIIAGQVDAPLSTQIDFSKIDIIFSSIYEIVGMLRKTGVTSYFQPPSFSPYIQRNLEKVEKKDASVIFIGNIKKLYTNYKDIFEKLAHLSISVSFWGYGAQHLPDYSSIKKRYFGKAWGIDFYKALHRSRIAVLYYVGLNEDYYYNMHLVEAASCETCIITNFKEQINRIFQNGIEIVTYSFIEECVELIKYYLANPKQAENIANAAYRRTLKEYTFSTKVLQTSELLKKHLSNRKSFVLPQKKIEVIY